MQLSTTEHIFLIKNGKLCQLFNLYAQICLQEAIEFSNIIKNISSLNLNK